MKGFRGKAGFVSGAVGILTLAVLLGGCSADPPSPAPETSAPTAKAAPTPSPTPSLSVDTIVVHPTGIDLTSSGVVQLTLPYTATAQLFTSELAAAIGSAPTVKEQPSEDYRAADSTRYDWPGLVVVDEHRKEGGPGPSPNGPPTLAFTATAPTVGNGITVETIQGIRAGDTVASAAKTLKVDPSSDYFAAPAETGPVVGASYVEGQVNAPAVAVSQTVDDPTLVEIFAPYNFGDGHDI